MADEQDIGPQGPDQVIKGESVVGEQDESEPGGGGGKPRWLRKVSALFSLVAVRRPVPIAIAALLLGGAGAWAFLQTPAWKGDEPVKFPPVPERVVEDGLRQEEVARFYIPLPKEGSYQVLVVDWSVVWDGLSAVRFRKAEVMIRDRVYDGLVALAAKEEGLNENIPTIEENISRALKDSLRSTALSVRVKEVKTY